MCIGGMLFHSLKSKIVRSRSRSKSSKIFSFQRTNNVSTPPPPPPPLRIPESVLTHNDDGDSEGFLGEDVRADLRDDAVRPERFHSLVQLSWSTPPRPALEKVKVRASSRLEYIEKEGVGGGGGARNPLTL